MIRFIGDIPAKSDSKGRFFLPATLRKTLQSYGEETLVLRKDIFQDCLVLFPESVWNERMDELQSKLNHFNKFHEQILRQFTADSERISLDASGRLLIPKRYLVKAGIESEVHFIGVSKTIEIWASEKIEQAFMDNNEFAQALEELMKDSQF
ncbi:MAG: cell division/cell wall cluster transcriptional repressor MraZ [Bacteroidales bacterium]|nr:cell division/cell wall cluster transcriptional repressor MraZ [Bacteroidales bacterium]